MQLSFNKRTIFPSVYRGENKKTGEPTCYLSTTVFSPVKYNLKPAAGMMPTEQIQSILEECADNGQEVEIEFTEQQTKYGAEMQIFSVKPLPKKNPMESKA
ncbi:hypothetical protein ACWY7H_000328 [Acinetobacter baumannii]|uniref:Uncharacterized protein n=4 Tax=Acinetobacter baumannii TaxID=470 RepID=A0A241Y9U5_ACIBA|nr:hypothetical protein [Acinetobacter baumannii]ACJ41391.1 hypothetical protein AB57_2018 [Acinetobacter baumannii AB0057]ACJ41404.1 hypothetical protein AB57_2031 [Acinetobacter baumannii AB0057]ACJ41411.1 hypothetical protein AB57_2038 [Acinetobacter baumannii AB0057]ACJ41426.1 hypothetical protein AB57_2053 [Acinetobacter baumannii AB0057]ALJ87832.1 hypothetical protein AN415_01927 [Acinetobacter baumannii]